MKRFVGVILTAALVLGISACGNSETRPESSGEKPQSASSTAVSDTTGLSKENPVTLKLAITGEKSDVWENVKERLIDEGVDLELVFFSDYIIPNTALADGDVDLNAFQTEIFFSNYVEESGAELTSLIPTVLAPMGIYAGQIDDIAQLKENDKISVPNDPTNGGRALILLQAAGIIKVNPDAGLTPAVRDITENPLNIQIVELAAPQIPTTLDEVALGVVNSGIAVTAGFAPLEDSIFIEDENTEGIENYYNIIAVQTARKDDPAILKVIEIYQTDETKEVIKESSNGANIPIF